MTRSGSARGAEVRVTSPAPRDVWARVYASDPNAVPTQSPEWLDCLCATRGRVDASRAYELPDGRTAVLPLAGRRWAGVRVAEESWPYGWVYGGALVEGGELTAADAQVVLSDLARRPVVRVGVVPMPLTGRAWSDAADALDRPVVRVPYLSQSLELDGGFDVVFSKRIRRDTRRLIRRAREAGLDVVEYRGDDADAAVDVFAGLYAQSNDRWATAMGRPLALARLHARLQDRAGQLRVAARALGARCRMWTAHLHGEPVAVLAVIQEGRHSFAWLSAMDTERGRETPAGHLLMSLAVEGACAEGASWFHFGESAPGSGVERFKAGFGAHPVEYEALVLERLPLTAADRRLREGVSTVAAWRPRRSSGG